ncbi:MAG: VWA domain-containing protein, partial [Candidatus Margulisbacteria bacterium]|nr:VWA domain-containing protein [Candidatus Margulisiibacteriota bacterium]
GSMGGAITGSKNSINAFAASLEADGADAQFAVVNYGDSAIHPTPPGWITSEGIDDADATRECSTDFGNAAAIKAILDNTIADDGNNFPENPLDAILYAWNTYTWRAEAQKIFIIITDDVAHQNIPADTMLENVCTTSGEAILSLLSGQAVVYAVSPHYTTSQYPYLDVRRLADGLGEGRVTAEANTGGKWIQFVSAGFDLATLGIVETVVESTSLKLSYTFTAGVWYIYVQVDTDGDGVYDSNMLIKVTVAASSSTFATFGVPAQVMDVELLESDDGKLRLND